MDDSEEVIRELNGCPSVERLTMADVLGLPDSVRALMNRLVRERPSTHAELVHALQCGPSAAEQLIGLLVEKGYIRQDATGDVDGGEPVYRVDLSPIRGRAIDEDLL